MNMNLWKIKGDNSLIYKSSFWSNYCYNNSAGTNMISNDLLHNSYCYSTLHPKIHPQLHHLRCPHILACIHCCIYRWGVEISAANIFLVVSRCWWCLPLLQRQFSHMGHYARATDLMLQISAIGWLFTKDKLTSVRIRYLFLSLF